MPPPENVWPRRRRVGILVAAIATASSLTVLASIQLASWPAPAATVIGTPSIGRQSHTGDIGMVLPPLRNQTLTPSSPVPDGPPLSYPQLPGYGQPVAAQDAQTLQRSMVELLTGTRTAGEPVSWDLGCTGTKVAIGPHVFVLTAAHCLSIPNDNYYSKKPARDVTKRTPYVFAVTPADGSGLTHPLVPVEHIIESHRTDAVLMSLDENDPGFAQFDALPAIDYQEHIVSGPEPGLATVSSSLPMSSLSRVDESGVYLGRAADTSGAGTAAVYDEVGLLNRGHADTVDRDPCYYGGSGSLAVLANGQLTGPLSERNRIAYYYGYSAPAGPDLTLPDSQNYRDVVNHELGVDSSASTTMCGYAVLDQPSIEEMVRALPR